MAARAASSSWGSGEGARESAGISCWEDMCAHAEDIETCIYASIYVMRRKHGGGLSAVRCMGARGTWMRARYRWHMYMVYGHVEGECQLW